MLRFLKAKLRVMQEEMEKLTRNYQELVHAYTYSITTTIIILHRKKNTSPQ